MPPVKRAEWAAPHLLQERTVLSCRARAQNWLYDEGEDEKKSVYVAKLDELRGAGEPVVRRALEASARPVAAASLAATCERLRAAATSSDAKLAHIPQADKDQARAAHCSALRERGYCFRIAVLAIAVAACACQHDIGISCSNASTTLLLLAAMRSGAMLESN